jgi:hypothetical protein
MKTTASSIISLGKSFSTSLLLGVYLYLQYRDKHEQILVNIPVQCKSLVRSVLDAFDLPAGTPLSLTMLGAGAGKGSTTGESNSQFVEQCTG